MKNIPSNFRVYLLTFQMVLFINIALFAQGKNTTLSFKNTPSSTLVFNYQFENTNENQTFKRFDLPKINSAFFIQKNNKTNSPYTLIKGDVHIQKNGKLTINSHHTLVIYGDLWVATEATLTNYGNLVIKGDLHIGNAYKGKTSPQKVKFTNCKHAHLLVRGNLVGKHPHGVSFDGYIAIQGSVGFHFHLGPNSMKENKAFYYTKNYDFTYAQRIEGKEKDKIISRLHKAPSTFHNLTKTSSSNFQHQSLSRLLPYLENDLPVELIAFEIEKEEHTNYLVWSTAQEINNSHFILERSFDNKHFEVLSKVKGHGNSNVTLDYEFAVKEENHKHVYYRLTQVDFDGKITSWIREVRNNVTENQLEINIFPNPTSEVLHIKKNDVSDVIEYNLVSISTGQTVALNLIHQVNNVSKYDVSSLEKGAYVLRITNGNKTITNKKIIIQ